MFSHNAAAATPAAAAASSPLSPPGDVVFRYKSNPCTTYFKLIITDGYEAKFFVALITHTVSRVWLGNWISFQHKWLGYDNFCHVPQFPCTCSYNVVNIHNFTLN